jgi:hypothetical protein
MVKCPQVSSVLGRDMAVQGTARHVWQRMPGAAGCCERRTLGCLPLGAGSCCPCSAALRFAVSSAADCCSCSSWTSSALHTAPNGLDDNHTNNVWRFRRQASRMAMY